MVRNVNVRFLIASIATMFLSFFAGYMHVGALYVFGLSLIPLPISLIVLWKTKASLQKKALVTLLCLVLVPVGFITWVWLNDIVLPGMSPK